MTFGDTGHPAMQRKGQVTAVSPLSLEGPDLRSTGDPARNSAAPFGDAAPFSFSLGPLPYSCPYLSLSSVRGWPLPLLIRTVTLPGHRTEGCLRSTGPLRRPASTPGSPHPEASHGGHPSSGEPVTLDD